MKLIYFSIAAALLFSCGTSTKEGEAMNDKDSVGKIADNVKVGAEVPNAKNIYVGDFVAAVYKQVKEMTSVNRITISIDEMVNGKIKGHSIVAGNNRPFEGTYAEDRGAFACEVKEPGDDKYDGAFSFVLKPDSQIIRGTWTANDKGLAVSARTYYLKQSTFRYDPQLQVDSTFVEQTLYNKTLDEDSEFERISDGILKVNASAQELRKEDIENLYKGDLEIVRNAIYARHGYSFKNRRMRYLFDKFVAWYIPLSTDVSKELTALELKNIELIKRYEKHAENYYDSYGR
jgi:hypothetical protein